MEKKMFSLCGKDIFVFDDVINRNDIASFYNMIEKLSFTRNEYDNKGEPYCIFSTDLIPDKVESQLQIGLMARRLINECFVEGANYILYRSYLNMSHYGDMSYPHRDCHLNEQDITILYYPNITWDRLWGGGTTFYEDGESRLLITPKPGRFVVFPGNIEHKGEIPTRICNVSRFSFALKYKLVNQV